MRLNDASLLDVAPDRASRGPDDAASFSRQVASLHKAVASGTDALAQAKTVESSISALIPKIGARKFTPDDVKAFLIGLIDDGLAGQYTDYRAPSRPVMAVQSVAEFMGRRQMLRTQPLKPSMKRLLASVSRDEKYQPAEFEKALREFKAGVETGAKK